MRYRYLLLSSLTVEGERRVIHDWEEVGGDDEVPEKILEFALANIKSRQCTADQMQVVAVPLSSHATDLIHTYRVREVEEVVGVRTERMQ